MIDRPPVNFGRSLSSALSRGTYIASREQASSTRTERNREFALLLALPRLRLSASPTDSAREIGLLMSDLHARSQFNGSILVAVHERIVYEDAFGAADIQTGARFTPATVSCLASVSKQFTAMAVMMLTEECRVAYDEEISRYFAELPRCYAAVSLRNLLNMTSGIVDYPELGADHPGITSNEVVQALCRRHALSFHPGKKSSYCNANYVLLSLIVERVSGGSFQSSHSRLHRQPSGAGQARMDSAGT